MILYILMTWFITQNQNAYQKYDLEIIDDQTGDQPNGNQQTETIKLKYGEITSELMQMHLINKLRFCRKFAYQLEKLPDIDIKPETSWS